MVFPSYHCRNEIHSDQSCDCSKTQDGRDDTKESSVSLATKADVTETVSCDQTTHPLAVKKTELEEKDSGPR